VYNSNTEAHINPPSVPNRRNGIRITRQEIDTRMVGHAYNMMRQ